MRSKGEILLSEEGRRDSPDSHPLGDWKEFLLFKDKHDAHITIEVVEF